jgi:excisionase family DNA binding protein
MWWAERDNLGRIGNVETAGNEARTYTASAGDVADRYGVHRNTVYGWVEATDIPHRKVVGVIRFNLDEVDEWMRTRTAPTGTPA